MVAPDHADDPCDGQPPPLIYSARENGVMPRKEVYCETCKSDQPLMEHEPQTDERNPHPWYDLTCGTCCFVIATVRIVPDDKPIEPSAAITDEPVQPL
jgi:hypothetical protein